MGKKTHKSSKTPVCEMNASNSVKVSDIDRALSGKDVEDSRRNFWLSAGFSLFASVLTIIFVSLIIYLIIKEQYMNEDHYTLMLQLSPFVFVILLNVKGIVEVIFAGKRMYDDSREDANLTSKKHK